METVSILATLFTPPSDAKRTLEPAKMLTRAKPSTILSTSSSLDASIYFSRHHQSMVHTFLLEIIILLSFHY